MVLELQGQNAARVKGPVTGNDYLFVRRAGNPPQLDVDDQDAPGMLQMTHRVGCCGNRRILQMFRAV